VQLSEASRLNLASVAWQVRSRVRSSFLDLYGALESRQLLARQQVIHADNLRIMQGQYEAGAISAFELSQARLAAAGAELQLRDAERREAEARARLAGAIGVPVAALEGVSFSFEALEGLPEDIDAAEVRQEALLNRPDVLSALAEYAASQSLLQLEIAGQYPDIHLGPGYEYDQGDDKWTLGLALTLPSDRNRGPIAEAQARREEAAARFDATQTRVLGEIELAVAAYRAAARKHDSARAILTDLTERERIARGMLEAGAISGSELAALRLQLSASEIAGLNASLEVQQAVGQLENAVQDSLGLPGAVWERSPDDLDASRGGDDR
jgi:outer membrane protein, heavy metal efflux system